MCSPSRRRDAENYKIRLSGFTVRKSFTSLPSCKYEIGSSCSVDRRIKFVYLHVSRRWASKDCIPEKSGPAFSRNTRKTPWNAGLQTHLLRQRYTTQSSFPFPFLCLNVLLFHLPRTYRQHWGKFRKLRTDCSKVKRTTPIMQLALQRAALFQP